MRRYVLTIETEEELDPLKFSSSDLSRDAFEMMPDGTVARTYGGDVIGRWTWANQAAVDLMKAAGSAAGAIREPLRPSILYPKDHCGWGDGSIMFDGYGQLTINHVRYDAKELYEFLKEYLEDDSVQEG